MMNALNARLKGLICHGRKTARWAVFLFLGLTLQAHAQQPGLRVHEVVPLNQTPAVDDPAVSFEDWFRAESSVAFTKLLANVSPADTALGVVLASPSTVEPNYYYHWIRDASLTMDVVVRNYILASDPKTKLTYWHLLTNYVDFSRANQQSNALTGLGEPKFYVDGRPYDRDWGRPQNDGPALRALTLIRFTTQLLAEGQWGYVRSKLYDATIPANTVIKADLEYVAHHWQDPSFDLWEEVKGDHFYTRMAQAAALTKGADLANTMGDPGAAAFYAEQAQAIIATLPSFWDPNAAFMRATLNVVGGNNSKSGLDAAVILAVLHAGFESGDFTVSDPRIMATAQRLESSFASIYSINDPNRFPDAGAAIGRYPEDIYSGRTGVRQGNPWVLTTAALGEYYYRLAAHVRQFQSLTLDATSAAFFRQVSGRCLGARPIAPGLRLTANSAEMVQLVNDLRLKGDAFMKRVRLHENPDGSLAEQIDRDNGYMRSARDLTWSYASVITAFWARQ